MLAVLWGLGLVGAKSAAIVVAGFVAGSLLASCGTSPSASAPVECSAESVFSLTVTVLGPDGTDVCDATVTATDGSFSTDLRRAGAYLVPGGPCYYVGPPERKGNYNVTARVGSRTKTISDVRVTSKNRCHVNNRQVTVSIG
jgi:hypothetical protein